MIKRMGITQTATIDVATWDLECETIWEKILYIEYCTWAGKRNIHLSLKNIARKLACTMTDFAESTINKELKKARKALEEKGIIKDTGKAGYCNTKIVELHDVANSMKQKRFKENYSKYRYKNLYQIKAEEKELEDDI